MSRLLPRLAPLVRPAVPRARYLATASAFDAALSSSSSSSSTPQARHAPASSLSTPGGLSASATGGGATTAQDPLAVDPDSETLNYLARLIMQDGKLARSHLHLSIMLEQLQLSTRSPPLPVLYKALELTSPQVRLVGRRKGTKVLQTPQPLTQKQQVRQAWLWIVEASDKRQSTEKVFGKRLAQEVLSVLNGQSEALKKLVARHEQAVTGRANVGR
ncbi:mitochondrial 37S ribosomal protein uS7m RSM7 [Sporobolomyces koalae]|uniref:mitochondrial 37S ribosomal protein uS7m RSM7 n=1 Tax=Sporobolomyces koalae TaxID=500713 RepID=UPI00317959CE